jgi:ATP-dependent helicase HrpB
MKISSSRIIKSVLPIDSLLPEIIRTVAAHPITLLEADPGAGKTTRVPPALLAAGLADIYVLEPRRLAARLAAARVADELREEVGGTVGYRVRFEEASSRATRLWYLTEGVLVRSLLGKQALQRASVVILDEFHERHLEGDVALALLRRLQANKPGLRLLIMSATLGGQNLRGRLGNAPLITAPGRTFPVAIEYTPASSRPLEEQVAQALGKAIDHRPGHVLIFLPGAAEIRKCIETCKGLAGLANAQLLALHGDLSSADQDRAVAPSAMRKIICSTNVAESSVTIDGVETVVDSGLARVRTHSPWSGFPRIHIQKISRSSAIQRAGRAGRTGPGVAIRLYSEAEFVRLPEQLPPELLRSELSELVLLLAAHGCQVETLPWLDAPPAEAVTKAQELLTLLAAFDAVGEITAMGRRMARLAVHPRLACLALRAAAMGARDEGCELAARLSLAERSPDEHFRNTDSGRETFTSDIDGLLARNLSYGGRRLKHKLLERIGSVEAAKTEDAIEKALLLAYPDRVARKRGEALLLADGGSARLDRASLVRSEFLVAIEIDDRSHLNTPLVRLASHVEPDWLLEFFPERVQTREELVWNRQAARVEQVNSLIYDQLVIDESRSAPADRAAASRILAAKAIETGAARFSDGEEIERFLRRIRFAERHSSIQAPANLVEAAFSDLATGLTSFQELQAAAEGGGLLAALEGKLPMRDVQEVAPTHVQLPSGRRARIEYHDERPPSVSSRLQDFFGMDRTPTVARGAVPLSLELLAPNRRPVQVTTDLKSFWRTLYPQLRRELSRRYPKHAWPEVPD